MKILAITNMYPTPANPWLGNFVEQQVKGLCEIGLEVEVLSLDRAAQGAGIYVRVRRDIHERLRKGTHDLVHVMYGGIMADLATRGVGNVPVAITIHGSDLMGEKLSDPVRRFSAHIGVLATRRAARRADGVIAVSNRLRDALPDNVARSKVRVIPCGIDLDRFKPEDSAACREKLGWSHDLNHILFATNGNAVKRPELARQAVAQLLHRGVRAELHEMRGIPYSQVTTWINASHAIVLTSLHEGSPTIVKECLACNVPVVSVDVGDVQERTKGIEGCFIVAANADDLATGLQEACAARSRVDGRSHMQELSLTRIAGRIREFYHEIISVHGGTSSVSEHEQHVYDPMLGEVKTGRLP
jgi:glycosyltransferase involved in cell wall biosynthesis